MALLERTLSDSIVLSDGIGEDEDTVSLSDSLATASRYVRTLSDSLAFTERLGFGFYRSASDSASISDSLSKVVRAARSVQDSVNLSGALTVELFKSLSESDISISDLLSVSRTVSRSAQDSALFSDQALTSLVKSISKLDAFPISDLINAELIRFVKDSVSIADAADTVSSYVREKSDPISIGEDFVIVAAFYRLVISGVSMDWIDSVDRISDANRWLEDHHEISDRIVGGLEIALFCEDGLSIGDGLSISEDFGRFNVDDIAVIDQSLPVHSSQRLVQDQPEELDSIGSSSDNLRSLEDSSGTEDLAIVSFELERLLEDSCSTSDRLERAVDGVRSVQDSVVMTETESDEEDFHKKPIDLVSAEDRIQEAQSTVRTKEDQAGISDGVSKTEIGEIGYSLSYFIKHFTFEESDRSRVTLGSNTRINPSTHRAELGAWDSNGVYPTDDDLYVKTWIANPLAVRKWCGLELIVHHKKVDGSQVTSSKLRLSDGDFEYFWNGSKWAVATSSDWNTEKEVNDHIEAFSITSKKLQVVINLKTTDDSVTPELEEVKVLYGALMDSELEDLVVRSFVPALKNGLEFKTLFPVRMDASSSSIKLVLAEPAANNEFRLDTEYRVVGVDGVFNHSDDPDHLRSVYLSHSTRTSSNPNIDGTVETITLKEAVSSGKVLWLRLKVEPVIVVTSSRDYYELEHVPSIVVESITYDSRELVGGDYIGNRSSFTAKETLTPQQGAVEISIRGFSDKLTDHLRLTDAMNRFIAANKTIISTGLDERYRLRQVSTYEFRPSPNEQDLHSFRKVFRIEHFRIWGGVVSETTLVKRLLVGGTPSIIIQ